MFPRRIHSRRCRSLVAGGLGVFAVSCTPVAGRYVPVPQSGATLTGTVTYKKELLRAGMVIVEGSGGGGTGAINPDGRYTVTNAPTGAVTVAVNTAAARGMAMGMAQAQALAGGPNTKAAKVAPPKVVDVPGKYADPHTSPLKTEVKPGENTFDVVIE
jgi:hypothetical protein